MNQDKVGTFIKEIRTKNKLTQREFADKFGVTYQAVSKWENGKNLPDINILKDICREYSVSLDEVLDGNKNKKNNKTKIILVSIVIIIITLISIFFVFRDKEDNTFEFKTLTSTCDKFKVSGSIAYNDIKSSIYISHVDYCGEDDKILYKELSCVLYEVDKDGKAITSVAAENFDFVRDITALKNYDFAYNDNTMLAKGTYEVAAEDTVKIGDKYYQFVVASVTNSANLNPNAGTYPVSVSVNESVHQVYFGYVEMDKLAYDANGGTGSMDPTEGYVGSAVTVSQNSFTRDKYIFVGWNTAADGSGTAYASGADYTLTSGDDVLYAQWEPLKPITITADSATKVYDGTALTKNSYTNTALAAGDSIESVTVTGSQTIVGTSNNVPSAAKIVNADGEDVTATIKIADTKVATARIEDGNNTGKIIVTPQGSGETEIELTSKSVS